MGLCLVMALPFGFGGLVILGIAIAIHHAVIQRRNRATVPMDAEIVEWVIIGGCWLFGSILLLIFGLFVIK